MAQVDGMTVAEIVRRMRGMDVSVVSGTVDPDSNHILLTTNDGAVIDAGEAGASKADVAAAVASADGGNLLLYTASEPVPPPGGTFKKGDTWFDADDGNSIHEWDGTSWVAVPLDAGSVLAPGTVAEDQLAQTVNDAITQANSLALDAQTSANSAIKTYSSEYAVSSSETDVPTLGWSTDTPTRTPGTFIWIRTVVTHGDGSTATTNPALLTGNTGAEGSPGIPGPPGDDGQALFTWVKYADTPTSGMSDSPTGKTYLGLAYNKTDSTESSVYSDYAWSLVKGADGDQGIPGPPGADGESTYTWIKYADDVSGGGLSDDPTGKPYLGIAYNKSVATESSVASDYTWSLIQGPAGSDGDPGAPGPPGDDGAPGVSITAIAPYFAVVATGAAAPAKPTTAAPSAPWVLTEPGYSAGTELYRTDKVSFSDGTYSYTAVTKVSAFTAAVVAKATADGKNTISYSTAAPQNGVSVGNPGDVWFVYNSVTGNVVSQYACTSTNTWVSRLVDNSFLASNIDAGKITAGYLDVANRINTNTINASKLVAKSITAASGVIGDLAVGTAQIQDLAVSNAKIADLAVTNAKILDATIQYAKIGSVDAGTISVGYLDAARIKAGTIDASKIAADSITVQQLAVVGSNMIANGGFENTAGAYTLDPHFISTYGGMFTVGATSTAFQGKNALSVAVNSQTVSGTDYAVVCFNGDPTVPLKHVPVKAGETWRFSAYVASGGGTPQFALTLHYYDAAGNYLNGVMSSYTTATSNFLKYTVVTGTIPPTATYMVPMFVMHGTGGAIGGLGTVPGSSLLVDACELMRQSSGDMLVDGAIDGKTITGATIQTAASGQRTELSPVTTTIPDPFSGANVAASVIRMYLNSGHVVYADGYSSSFAGTNFDIIETRAINTNGTWANTYAAAESSGISVVGISAYSSALNVAAYWNAASDGSCKQWCSGGVTMYAATDISITSSAGNIQLYAGNSGVVSAGTYFDHVPGHVMLMKTASSASTGTYTNLTWSSFLYNRGGLVNGVGDGSYNVLRAGVYRISISMEFTANTAGNRYVRLMKNGSLHRRWEAPGSSQVTQVSGSTIIELAVGDNIAIQHAQTSGASLNVIGDANAGTAWEINRLGTSS